MTESDLIPPYPHTVDVMLPENIQREISNLLQLAANCHNRDIEMQPCYVGLDADDEAYFLDCSKVPKPMIVPWVMMHAEQKHFVALIGCFEGWALPEEAARDYRKPGGYQGQISDHPDCIELLTMTVETKLGNWTGAIKFEGKYPEREMLEPKVMELTKATQVTGVMTNMLLVNRGKKTDLLATMRNALKYAKDNKLDTES